MTPDTINGTFELLGGCFLAMNCRRLYRDRQTRGVSILPFAFYTAWGIWNLYYYPSLHQTLSFIGGIGVVVVNALWVGMALYYGRARK